MRNTFFDKTFTTVENAADGFYAYVVDREDFFKEILRAGEEYKLHITSPFWQWDETARVWVEAQPEVINTLAVILFGSKEAEKINIRERELSLLSKVLHNLDFIADFHNNNNLYNLDTKTEAEMLRIYLG